MATVSKKEVAISTIKMSGNEVPTSTIVVSFRDLLGPSFGVQRPFKKNEVLALQWQFIKASVLELNQLIEFFSLISLCILAYMNCH